MTVRLGVLASHPIQYQAPLFRELAARCDLRVFFAHRQTAAQQAEAGFGVAFDWDVDLLGGYDHLFLRNRARRPDVNRFWGCDTPEIEAEIRAGGFDAFLVMGWYLRCYWQAVRACRRLGVPVMVRGDSRLGTPRGKGIELIKGLLYPHLLRRFDAFLYVGELGRAYLERYGAPPSRLFFSPHCVDNAWFAARSAELDREQERRRLGFDPVGCVALFVGKLLPGKRPEDLLAASALLRKRRVRLRVAYAGSGPLERSLTEESERLGLPATFLGFRNQSEMPSLYRSADLMALPSASETWGLVVNESLACGTPVVVSDAVGCAPDLVEEGVTGAVYRTGDVEALAAAVERVLVRPPARDRIRERIAAYSPQAAADGVLRAALVLRGEASPA
jgi:glycosyltransferase involved in cell wall biosynthesis